MLDLYVEKKSAGRVGYSSEWIAVLECVIVWRFIY